MFACFTKVNGIYSWKLRRSSTKSLPDTKYYLYFQQIPQKNYFDYEISTQYFHPESFSINLWYVKASRFESMDQNLYWLFRNYANLLNFIVQVDFIMKYFVQNDETLIFFVAIEKSNVYNKIFFVDFSYICYLISAAMVKYYF